MSQVKIIWALLIVAPGAFLLGCICCPCISFTVVNAIIKDNFDEFLNKIWDWQAPFWFFVIKDREPKICTKKIHPFKIRSPFSASKSYKSPENLNKIIEKSPSEVSSYNVIIPLLYL